MCPEIELPKAIQFVIQQVDLETEEEGAILEVFLVAADTGRKFLGSFLTKSFVPFKFDLVNDETIIRKIWHDWASLTRVITSVMVNVHSAKSGVFVDAIYIGSPDGTMQKLVHYIIWQPGISTVLIRNTLPAAKAEVEILSRATTSTVNQANDRATLVASVPPSDDDPITVDRWRASKTSSSDGDLTEPSKSSSNPSSST